MSDGRLRSGGGSSWIGLLLVATLLAWAAGFTPCAAAEQDHLASGSQEYLVGIGDVLEVSVWNEPEVSKTVFVRLDGKVSLPLAGDVLAHGASPEALSQRISDKMSKFFTAPSVTVTVKASNSRIYYVLGQIAKPGEYSLNTPVSVLQAIARAGGFGEWAKKEKIMVVRRSSGQDRMINFNYEEFLSGDGQAKNIYIEPGDTIVVP